MSVSVNSQVLLKKTVWNNENAFIGNESAMDSISETYFKLKSALSDNKLLLIEIKLKDAEINKLMLQVDFLTNDKTNHENKYKELENKMLLNAKIHENDLDYYKAKSKGGFKNFLLGTAIGGLIVAIITLI